MLEALTLAAAACSGFSGDDPPDAPTTPGVVEAGAADAPASLDAGADAEPAVPFCDRAGGGLGATRCTDFEPTTELARIWDRVLDSPESQGVGELATVRASGDPTRNHVYVARFNPVASAPPGIATSRRSHQNIAPTGWTTGIPARTFQMQVYVAVADAKHGAGILGWEGNDATAHAIVAKCPDAAETASCTLEVWRGTNAFPIPKAILPKKTWTKLVVVIPSVTYTDGGGDQAPGVTVTTEVAGGSAEGSSVALSPPAPAPRVFRADVGIVALDTTPVAWEVWYDDLALTY